jgi:hypothetical protein
LLYVASHVGSYLTFFPSLLYVLVAALHTPVLAVVVVSQPQYILARTLGYIPLLITSTLYIIEDYSRWPPWLTETRDLSRHSEQSNPGLSQTTMYERLPTSSLATNKLNYASPPPSLTISSRAWSRESTFSARAQEGHLTKFMWSPSQSRASSFNSRLSDISLPSSRPESLPSSWGTLTRGWFPEFSARETDSLS